MAKTLGSVEKMVGETPLVRLRKIEKYCDFFGKIYAKIEGKNPSGSVKDRPALFMLNDMERRGIISRGSRIVEATSGNMGISLAFFSAVRGYRAVIVMPRSASVERQIIIKSLGASLVPTDGGMEEAINKAREILDEGGVSLMQFDNPMNSYSHELTTGPEIWRDTRGEVDMFVCGVGTGGTISGVGRCLKRHNPSVKIVAVEPTESQILSGGKPGKHKIQGIGAGFLPTILDKNIINSVVSVNFEQAKKGVSLLAMREGILSGLSSGAAIWATVELARREENQGKNIVTLLPDGIEKYLSCLS